MAHGQLSAACAVGFWLLLALLLVAPRVVVGSRDIVVRDGKLYVNCKEFFIKAMCYSPTPLGIKIMSGGGVGGGGYCSPKRNYRGELRSPCYMEDFFDGSSGSPLDTNPPEGWFQALWRRDFPAMKELGVNTIRIYHIDAITLNASQRDMGKGDISMPYGKSHIEFMNMAAAFGFRVIYELIGNRGVFMNTERSMLEQYLRNQIDEVGNHPALLMWALGNEWGPGNDARLVTRLNQMFDFVRNYTLEKFNRTIPVTHVVVDDPFSYAKLAASLRIDIFGANAGYRGFDFQDLWDGKRTPGFVGWQTLSRQYNKPLFIAEIGWHSVNSTIDELTPDWFNQIWKDLVDHIDMGTVGGAFFEFQDEELTKLDPLQKHMGVFQLQPSYYKGKWSTEPYAWNPDTLVKKPLRWAMLKNGTFMTKPYNLNADVFALLGRPAAALPGCVPTDEKPPVLAPAPCCDWSVDSTPPTRPVRDPIDDTPTQPHGPGTDESSAGTDVRPDDVRSDAPAAAQVARLVALVVLALCSLRFDPLL